nr:MAG TPA: hypothetical protein [Caudoviricetes sp.]
MVISFRLKLNHILPTLRNPVFLQQICICCCCFQFPKVFLHKVVCNLVAHCFMLFFLSNEFEDILLN